MTQARHGNEMIRRCERDNLFILPLVGQGAWYRFHHLFADALREQLGEPRPKVKSGTCTGGPRNGSRPTATSRTLFAMRLLVAIGPMPSPCSRWSAPSFSTRSHRDAADLAAGDPARHPRHLPATGLLVGLGTRAHGSLVQGSASLRIAEEAWAASGDRLGEGLVLLWHAVRWLWDEQSPRDRLRERPLDALPADRPIERILALMTPGSPGFIRGAGRGPKPSFQT